jgi:3-phosphoglycerate kinase
MVFTFLKAQGHEVGKSLLEDDQLETCLRYLTEATERGVEIVLPTDIVVADSFGDEASARVVEADAIPAETLGLDVARFDADRRSETVLARVKASFRAGVSCGVVTTPSAFLDGVLHPGRDVLDALS